MNDVLERPSKWAKKVGATAPKNDPIKDYDPFGKDGQDMFNVLFGTTTAKQQASAKRVQAVEDAFFNKMDDRVEAILDAMDAERADVETDDVVNAA